MEIRNYPRTRIQKIFFLYKLRFIFKPAWVMFCRFLYQFLWSLTIVGGIIKWFEYRMIPYILAENPAIGKKDAFFLSRQLMRNNKRRLFFLYLSFFGWKCLSLLTLGIFDILFVNPYLISTETELYMHLRRNYVLSRLPRYEKLNDLTLEHVPSEDELLISKALYDDSHGPYTKISYFAPEQYPAFLYSIQPPEHAVKAPADPNQKYPFSSVCFLFFAFSVFGWLLEFAMTLLRDGVFMTRSFLFGPWFPLYGICGICILLIMRRHTQRPIAAFFLGMGVYSLLEYGVSWLTELCLHIRLWDYSGYFLNLNGRIYLGGTATFALLGCAFLYYLAPKWNAKFLRLSRHSRMAICLL